MHQEIYRNNFGISHTINTRQRNLAVPEFQRLSQTQRSTNYIGPIIWNEIPAHIREISSLPMFKKRLKSFYIDQYGSIE